MSEDPWEDPSAVAWAKHVLEDMAPKMQDSAVVVQLVNGVGDVKFWVELGASIMMNKPILAVVLGDSEIPPKLRLIADEIVILPEGVSGPGSEQLAETLVKFAKEHD